MKYLTSLYFWILIGFVGGVLLGLLDPELAVLMEPFGVNFIKLVKIFIPPIIFLTITTGIVQTGSLKQLGRIGFKTFIYFEVVSTFALLLGWIAASCIKPGALVHADVHSLAQHALPSFLAHSQPLSFSDFLQGLIPSSLIGPFIEGNLLQTLFLAILTGISLLLIQENASTITVQLMDKITQSLFQCIRLIMWLAPLGVFGSISFTIAKFGIQFLLPLGGLIATFYLTAFFFVIGILGLIAKMAGFSILKFLRYLTPELLLVLGTSSSESGLPALLKKLENLGCSRETVGVVIPIGYSFNLDGTNIYITLGALFIAQALGVELSFSQELALFATAMLSSKGAAGITGAGFITLAATLSVVPSIPPIGIVLVLGIDRFMSEVRALVNFIGNGVAAVVISRWENEMSPQHLNQRLVHLTRDCQSEKSVIAS